MKKKLSILFATMVVIATMTLNFHAITDNTLTKINLDVLEQNAQAEEILPGEYKAGYCLACYYEGVRIACTELGNGCWETSCMGGYC